MSLPKFYLLFTAVLMWTGVVRGIVFSQDFCETQCASSSDFIENIPAVPIGEAGNRPFAWSIVAQLQIQENLGAITPPGAGRVCGLTGTCLFEAAALTTKRFRSTTDNPLKLPWKLDDASVTNTMDGAGFWAVKALFEDFPSFGDVSAIYEAFSGMTIDDLIPVIDFALKLPTKLLKAYLFTLDKRSAEIVAGAVACQRVVDKITEDGFVPNGSLRPGEVDPTGYMPVNLPQKLAGITDCDNEITDIGRWQPLCVPQTLDQFGTTECEPQEFAFPWAGRWTTFALEEGDETTGGALVPPPPPVGSKEFEKQFREILEISATLGDVLKIIAEYWADGPDTTAPPGHLWKIAGDAAFAEGLDQLETARLLFVVGNAVYDAGIASWRTKVTFDYARPLSVIQCGEFRGETELAWQGPYMGVGLTNISEWRPFQAADFVTPNFAAYTSGHSTFSAAGSEAMRLFFGDDTYRGPSCYLSEEGTSFFEPKSDILPGFSDIPNTGPMSIGYVPADDVVLCWETWTQASDESGFSRFPGGIHIQADDDGGQLAGRNVGRAVYEKALKFFDIEPEEEDDDFDKKPFEFFFQEVDAVEKELFEFFVQREGDFDKESFEFFIQEDGDFDKELLEFIIQGDADFD